MEINKIPNSNYPLPEKWYVQRTLENAEKLNKLCNYIFPSKNYTYGTKETEYKAVDFYTKSHFIHSIEKPQNKTTCKKPKEGYTEVTYEDLWLAYVIPEKWYCGDVKCKDFKRWRKLNNKPSTSSLNKLTVLSKHLTNNSYYWGGHIESLKEDNSYKDYKEISKETYLKLLDILEQKKNSNNMSNKNETVPTEVLVPITEFKKIVDVACTNWQGKLKAHILENLQNDCVSVKVTRDFYEQMIKAATTRNGVNQADVINSVLPVFKHDPYKVFRDAVKEGKTIQVFNTRWSDVINPVFNNSPENYRIKHKHQDLIDEWEASGRTKLVEYLNSDNEWIVVFEPSWNEYIEYRFKPEPKYVPFTFEDAEFLIGKAVKSKDGSVIIMLNYFGRDTGVLMGTNTLSFKYLFDKFTFLDGSPCGKLVTE